jgi:hypothetical protein
VIGGNGKEKIAGLAFFSLTWEWENQDDESQGRRVPIDLRGRPIGLGRRLKGSCRPNRLSQAD